MTETSDWLEAEMLLKVVWSSVMVEYGVLSVETGGEHLMLRSHVVN